MTFTKRKLSDAELGYSITSLELLGEGRIVAAAEGPGPAVTFGLGDLEARVLASGPGGCMGFASVPGRGDAVLMITEFYPIFQSEGAGVHLYTAASGFDEPWTGSRVLDLPFVHRIATVMVGDTAHLVAATVCGGKEYQDDWSQPGSVYVAPIPGESGLWLPEVVMEGIHKNHGMNTGTYKGRQTVFISGTEGVFALGVPDRTGDTWQHERIMDHEVSEVFPYDLDGDGEDELAVIEPFHGDTVAIYKQRGGSWDRVFAAPLGFGHGLWAGSLAGEACVIVGNRSGTKNLCAYTMRDGSFEGIEEVVVDAGSGTTNLDVLEMGDRQVVVASNAEHAEYALYEAKGESS